MKASNDNNDSEKCKEMNQPFTLNLEFFNDDISEDTDALKIDLSESEQTDGSSRGRKRKLVDNEKDRHEMMEAINGMEEEIERQLDAKAAKSNLTVMNVKNILRTVITDDYVLNMVKRSLLGNYSKDDLPYEPKLTRAKTKEFLKSQPSAMWQIKTSAKPASRCHVLIEEELPEDSSDEEYQPNQDREQSEEEKETINDSDKESSGQESEAESNKESDGESDSDYDAEDKSVSRIEESGADKILDPSVDSETKALDPSPPSSASVDIAKVKEDEGSVNASHHCPESSESPASSTPKDCETQTSWTYDEAYQVLKESIGQRTRSKFSLSNTLLEDIERAFIPPDITTDMYDSECDDEDWKKFLKDFSEPLLLDVNNTIDDDEEADPEYNVLADVEEVEEDEYREELRIDRGVKVSKREVNLLMAELFEYSGMFSSDEDEPKKQEYEVDEEPSVEVDETADPYRLTAEQRLLLDQQMRKHVQLLTQNFMQTYCHPMLNAYSSVCKKNLTILRDLAGVSTKSAFNAGNLKEAVNLVEHWEEYLSVESNRKEYVSFTQAEMKKKVHNKNTTRGKTYICRFHPKLMEIVSNSEVFLYPLLLPEQPFRCDLYVRTLFVPGEEKLLTLGLEQFSEYVKHNPDLYPKGCCNSNVVPLVQKHLMPAKTTKQLYDFISKRSKMDSCPFKHTPKKRKPPGDKHFVIPYSKSMIRPPRKQPKELLPNIWRHYIYPDADARSILL